MHASLEKTVPHGLPARGHAKEHRIIEWLRLERGGKIRGGEADEDNVASEEISKFFLINNH